MSSIARARSLFHVRLTNTQALVGTIMAAAFNVLGMPIELIILRSLPSIPRWPLYTSIAFSAGLLTALLIGKRSRMVPLAPVLFVLHAAVISFALYHVEAQLGGRSATVWAPFQATKVGALVVGVLAPGFAAGLVAIALHVSSSVIQFLRFSPELQASIGIAEPWATLAFGLAGVLVLSHRLRVRQLEVDMLLAHARAESNRRLARTFLHLRDLMNTPLQAIEIGVSLLGKNTGDETEILRQIRESSERLRDISHMLKRYERSEIPLPDR